MKGEQIRLNMMHTRLAPPSPWRTSPASPSSLSAPVRPTPTSRVWMQRLISSKLLTSWTTISWLLWPNRKLNFCRRWWQHWWNRSSEIGTILACSQNVFKQKFLIYHLLLYFAPKNWANNKEYYFPLLLVQFQHLLGKFQMSVVEIYRVVFLTVPP